jgi:hypothetical protein
MDASAATPAAPYLEDVRVEDLPAAYGELARAIGLPAALSLIWQYSGARLTVPSAVGAAHPLARRLGVTTAQALARHAGGSVLTVPTLRSATIPARDRAIRAAYRERRTPVPELARRFGLAERRIQQIVARDMRVSEVIRQ